MVPTVRQRRLGAELRRLREHSGRTLEESAYRLQWSASKLSRIENARIGVQVSDVHLLLDLYRVDHEQSSEVLTLAHGAGRRGWWADFSGVFPRSFASYVALEDEADSALAFATYIVPGLLQTEEYARIVLETAEAVSFVTPKEIARRLEGRMFRQRLLHKADPLALSVILDESVLLRSVGGAGVMNRQLTRLAELAEESNIQLIILPLNSHREPMISESFTILKFDPAYEIGFPDVVYVEGLALEPETQDDHVTHRYRIAWERLRGVTLSAEDSLRMILRIRAEHWPR